MAIFCWGELAKTANDTTTIAEYIQASVLKHNVSPQAHGLDSYAIYNHRVDNVIDHKNYSITSDKITSNQIIGKDFRTAEDVGESVDGIKFDRNAIEMWEDAERKVYIPKSGDPEFQGVIKCESLQYLKKYVATFFESVDQWVFNRGGYSAKNRGMGSFEPYGARTGDEGLDTYIMATWLDKRKNPEMNICASRFSDEFGLAYFGMGVVRARGWFSGNDSFAGFFVHRAEAYGVTRIKTKWYIKHIKTIEERTSNIFKCRVKYSENKAFFSINGEVEKSVYYGYNYYGMYYLYNIFDLNEDGENAIPSFEWLSIQQDLKR